MRTESLVYNNTLIILTLITMNPLSSIHMSYESCQKTRLSYRYRLLAFISYNSQSLNNRRLIYCIVFTLIENLRIASTPGIRNNFARLGSTFSHRRYI